MSEEQKPNYEALYNIAQQELANSQHTVRLLVHQLQELNGQNQEQPITGEVVQSTNKKKPN